MASEEADKSQMNIPHLFRCPISLDIFTDPVTLSTGQTYDRSSIEKWLADGNLTCPVTMQKLQDPSLIPNHTLRELVNQWVVMDSKLLHPNSVFTAAELESLTTMKMNLQCPDSPKQLRLETLRRIKTLSAEPDSPWRDCLIQTGFCSLLLDFIFGNAHVMNSAPVEEALDCVLQLAARSEVGTLNMLKEASKFSSLCSLFGHGNMKIKISLCYLAEKVTSSMDTRELALMLGQSQSILKCLVFLLEQKTDPSASDAAWSAISGLCVLEPIQENVVREGGVDGFVQYLENPDRRFASKALASLELLAGLESGRRALINNPKAIHVLVKMVFRTSDLQASESSVGLLLILCSDSFTSRRVAISAGVVRQLLLLLQSQSSGKSKDKARTLLKLLRTTCDLN